MIVRTLLVLGGATIVVGAPAFAQPRVFANAPAAAWIAPASISGDSAIVFHARRSFDLAEVPARFTVHVSADNRYRLFVNGRSVSSGPQRADALHWRYETLDLAPLLHPGRNVVAAVVWNWGATRPIAQHTVRTGVLVQGDSPREAALLNTGAGWRLHVDSGARFVPPARGDINGYFAAAPGEALDGAQHPWGWEQPGFDDGAWPVVQPRSASLVGSALTTGAGGYGDVSDRVLMARDIPPMEETAERYASVRRSTGIASPESVIRGGADAVVPPHTTASLLLDRGRVTNAYLQLDVSSGRGSTVTLTTAEALVNAAGQKGNRNAVDGRTIRGLRDTFRPDGGAHRQFATLQWRTHRYLQLDIVTGDEPLVLHDVHGTFTGYPFTERGRFTSDAAWLDSVWTIDWNGARLGAVETYMDTPYYEQLQYIGDTRLQALITLYVAGDDRLVRQAIEQFDASRIADGITASRYPSSLMQLIPPFSLLYVAMVHDYAMLRDDRAFVQQRLAGIRGVLDWYGRQVDSTGMLGPMPHWNYLDWSPVWDRGVPPGAERGHSAAISLLYAYALQRAAALEQQLGVPALGSSYRARADSIIRATRARSWDAARGLYRDSPDTLAFSQHTNVLALLTGAVPPAGQRAVMERVLADTTLAQASYYFRFYVLEALRDAGMADRYVPELAPWRTMLALGLTSTPEQADPTRSDTHAWAAHPNYGLLATVLGVRPASPGFRTVFITPALGPLQRAHGRVAHPAGDLDVSLERVGATGVSATITLPPGVTGMFRWNGTSTPLRPGRQVVRR